MHRKRFLMRAKTTSCRKRPADFKAKDDSFRELVEKQDIELNMDEVPLTMVDSASQIPEDKSWSDEDLDSEGREDMKASGLSPTAPETDLSWNSDSDSSADINNINGPAWRLRNRRVRVLATQDKHTEPDDGERTDSTPPVDIHASNVLTLKRRPGGAEQQVPNKVSSHEDSHEASAVMINDAGCAVGAGTGKQVEARSDKLRTDADVEEGECSSLLKTRQMYVKEEPVLQSGQASKSVGSPPTVKTENAEVELDHLKPLSVSNSPISEYQTTLKSEDERNTVRCKKSRAMREIPAIRKSYSADYKLQVVKYAARKGNRAAERKFGMSESLVRSWRKAEVALAAMEKTRKANRGQKAKWPELEERVHTWVLEQRAAGRRVSAVQLRLHAMAVAKEIHINDFAGGPSWCNRFMHRKRISLIARNTLCQKPPADLEPKVDSFCELVDEQVTEHESADHIINMDENPLIMAYSASQTFDMGSKMSLGKGSSDQNTVSEVTVTPHSSIQAPLDVKKVPEDTSCSDDEQGDMKASDLSQTAPDSWNPDSDNHVNSEASGGTNNRIPPCSADNETSDSSRQTMVVHKKRRRVRKLKLRRTPTDESSLHTTHVDALQHKGIRTLPSPVYLQNHPIDDVSNNVAQPSINNSPPLSVSDGNVEDGANVLTKSRQRAKKALKGMFTDAANASAAAAAAAAAASAADNCPARRLRSRGARVPATQDKHTESDDKPDSEQSTPPVGIHASNVLTVKRRRPGVAELQVPIKVSRREDSHEASAVMIDDAGCAIGTGADKQRELSSDKLRTVAVGKCSSLSKTRQEHQMEVKEEPALQSRQTSRAAAEGLNNLNSAKPPQSYEQSISDLPKDTNMQVSISSSTVLLTEKCVKPIGSPPALKTESVEVELDHLKPISESNSPISEYHNTTMKDENEQNAVGYKKGRKRRGWSPKSVKKEEAEEGHSDTDAQFTAEYGEMDMESKLDADANIIYITRGSKTLLKCGLCNRTYKFLSQFVIHQRIHTGERPFKCPDCGKGFTKNSNLNIHIKTHTKSNVYQKCPFCKIKFSCSEYMSHMQMHTHMLTKVSGHKIEKPSIENKKEDGVASHAAVSTGKKQKVCQYCGKMFPFQSALVRHVRVHTGEKPYKCDICGKAYGQAYFLRVHELTHWSVKRYNCTRCEKSFTHYSNAKNHTCRPVGSADNVEPKRYARPSLTYTCHICKSVCDQLQEFNTHMKAHTGAKLYRCCFCDKLFGGLSEFNIHRSQCRERNACHSDIQEDEKMSLIQYTVPTLRCSSAHCSSSPVTTSDCKQQRKRLQMICKKRASAERKKPFQLVVPAHQLSCLVSKLNKLDNRSDPRRYLCPSCGRQFRHMGRLRAHMLTHAQGQSYTCSCCGKTLESWRKLWRHQRIHRQRRGRFTCPKCGQGFRFVEPYKRHMSEHRDFQWVQFRPKKVFRPYQCDQCRSSFKTLDLLFDHQLCHSAMQDDAFDLSMEEYNSQTNKETPTTNNPSVTVYEDEDNRASPVCPDLVPQQSHSVPGISLDLNQGFESGNALSCPSSTDIVRDTETSGEKEGENALGQPVKLMNRCTSQNDSKPNDGSSDGFQCAMCGSSYSAISVLYEHYIQHARGQV